MRGKLEALALPVVESKEHCPSPAPCWGHTGSGPVAVVPEPVWSFNIGRGPFGTFPDQASEAGWPVLSGVGQGLEITQSGRNPSCALHSRAWVGDFRARGFVNPSGLRASAGGRWRPVCRPLALLPTPLPSPGHLTDQHLAEFLRRCQRGLRPNGIIVIKDNMAQEGVILDDVDSSVCRDLEVVHRIIRSAGLSLLAQERQENLPDEIYHVYSLALR